MARLYHRTNGLAHSTAAWRRTTDKPTFARHRTASTPALARAITRLTRPPSARKRWVGSTDRAASQTKTVIDGEQSIPG